MLPLGEAPESGTAWQIAVAGVVGGIVTKIADYTFRFFRDKWEEDRRDRKEEKSEAIERMEKLLDRVEQQLAASQRENVKWQEIANRATVRAERAVVWIKHLESRLRELGVKDIEPWTEVDGDSKTVYRPPMGPNQ